MVAGVGSVGVGVVCDLAARWRGGARVAATGSVLCRRCNHSNSICADVAAATRPLCLHYTAAARLPLHSASIKDKSIRQPIPSEFNRVSESSRAPSLPPQLAHGALPPTTTHPARKTNKKSCPQNGRRLPPDRPPAPAPLRDCIPAALINMAVFLPPLLIARIPPGLPPRPRRRRLNR